MSELTVFKRNFIDLGCCEVDIIVFLTELQVYQEGGAFLEGSCARWSTFLFPFFHSLLSQSVGRFCEKFPFLLQDTVSVHRPSFYADRFLKFMGTTVFKKAHGKRQHTATSSPVRLCCPLTLLLLNSSFERSVLQEEEELTLRIKVRLPGVSVLAEGEGGE